MVEENKNGYKLEEIESKEPPYYWLLTTSSGKEFKIQELPGEAVDRAFRHAEKINGNPLAILLERSLSHCMTIEEVGKIRGRDYSPLLNAVGEIYNVSVRF